jgi:hypothetical protein
MNHTFEFENIKEFKSILRRREGNYVKAALRKMSISLKILNLAAVVSDDENLKNELTMYFYVGSASALEAYIKGLIMDVFERKKCLISEKNLKDLMRDKITIKDAFDIFRKIKPKPSEIDFILIKHSFQSLKSINEIFNKLFGKTDFLKELEEYEIRNEELRKLMGFRAKGIACLKRNFPNWKRELQDIFNKRNNFLHNNIKVETKKEKGRHIFDLMISFIVVTQQYYDLLKKQ